MEPLHWTRERTKSQAQTIHHAPSITELDSLGVEFWEDCMRRIIELVSGLAATTTGLIGVVTQVRAIAYPYNNFQLVAFPTVGLNTWSEISSEIDHFMFLLAILLVGVSIGAYLHAVHQST